MDTPQQNYESGLNAQKKDMGISGCKQLAHLRINIFCTTNGLHPKEGNYTVKDSIIFHL